MRVLVWSLVCCTLVAACSSPAATGDAALPPPTEAGSGMCGSDGDCDDGSFCTGVEQCSPGAMGANARGCVSMGSPCTGAARCIERVAVCTTCTAEQLDVDGDGAVAMACGGNDCDDADARRFPANLERCDLVDDDCNPETLGPDADRDTFVGTTCCNAQPAGAMRCGSDCDDDNPLRNGNSIEVCNGVDDDCDGLLDHPDEDNDRDGHADDGCAGTGGSDCNDMDPTIYDGAPDPCDATDQSCDGLGGEDADGDMLINPADTCMGGPKGAFPKTDCDDTTTTAQARDGDGDGALSVRCCTQRAMPGRPAMGCGTDCDDANPLIGPNATERCNMIDDDCDGMTDEGVAGCTPPTSTVGTVWCGATTTCTIGTQECCAPIGGTPSCVANDSCAVGMTVGVAITECDEPADCGTGRVCCGNITLPRSRCFAGACPAGEVPICRRAADCPGATCNPQIFMPYFTGPLGICI